MSSPQLALDTVLQQARYVLNRKDLAPAAREQLQEAVESIQSACGLHQVTGHEQKTP